MEFLYLSWIDYALCILMLAISAGIGIYYGFFAKQEKTTTIYLLGGKNMNYLPVGMSLAASCISSPLLLGYPTEVYLFGTIYMQMIPWHILVGLVIHYTILPVFWKLKISSSYEYLEIRFDKTIRSLASWLYILIYILHVSFVIYSPSLAFNQVTGFNIYGIAIIMSAICIFYTTVGGLKAIVWTDTLQLAVMLLTLVCVFAVGISTGGGFATIWERVDTGKRIEYTNMDIDPTVRITFWGSLIGTIFAQTAHIGTNPYTVQRFLAVKNLQESRKALWLFLILFMFIQAVSCFFGVIIYARYYDCDPLSAGYIQKADQILIYYILDVAKGIPGLSGLFIAGLFSASLSTLSTLLNILSSLIYDEIVPLIIPKRIIDGQESNILKVITIIVGVVGIALVFIVDRLGTLLELLTWLHGISLAPLIGIFTLGLVFPLSNKKGALTGAVASVVYMIFYAVMRQMYVWNGKIKYTSEIKPLRTDGCNITSIISSTTQSYNSSTTMAPKNDQSLEEVSPFYKISFLYFIVMGGVLTIVVGVLVSLITYDRALSVNENTLSPCIRKFLKKFKNNLREEEKKEYTFKFEGDDTGAFEEECTN